ncbi:GNAT family N-acetyltransferase [Reinekea marina]|uniref:GNAT family N-acetyltransferase n=1 Tax=Reinekea marina TaxID=1310421 RepID=A0ABV7WN02_9GAMM|nr:GNAT family N-acetyltransferase [Reinekea marina]MDN3649538.1 GNAT family N-acetyltransferase [Reinekea marina]
MQVKEIELHDDLSSLVSLINNAMWDDANEISVFDVESLTAYLSRQDTVFLACYIDEQIAGIASARIEIKPYGKEQWLYIDEVDVCVNFRKLGVGKYMMKSLLTIAKAHNCTEAWLGTETDNKAANALYSSLKPTEIEEFIGFNFDLEN